jgi:hypothetical protein
MTMTVKFNVVPATSRLVSVGIPSPDCGRTIAAVLRAGRYLSTSLPIAEIRSTGPELLPCGCWRMTVG